MKQSIVHKALLAKARPGIHEEFTGNQTGGRVFLFPETDDFESDYQHLISSEILFHSYLLPSFPCRILYE